MASTLTRTAADAFCLQGRDAGVATLGRATHHGDRGPGPAQAVAEDAAEDAGPADDGGHVAGQVEDVHQAVLAVWPGVEGRVSSAAALPSACSWTRIARRSASYARWCPT